MISRESLFNGKWCIFQDSELYRFSIDPVLLTHFASAPKKSFKILDLGTGCGIIPVILSIRYLDVSFSITGIDIQKELIDLAKMSAKENGFENIEFICEDFIIYNRFETYEMIFSNPPYYAPDSGKLPKTESDKIARHEIKSSVSDVFKISGKHLSKKGKLFIIFPGERFLFLLKTANRFGLRLGKIRMIHSRINSDANMILAEFSRQGNASPVIMPPLIIYNKYNKYTEEVQKYYEI